jgi:putative lipoic acid-binding regulatory protein
MYVGGTLFAPYALTSGGSFTVGGGYGSTGLSIYSTGNLSTNGNLIVDGSITTNSSISLTEGADRTIQVTTATSTAGDDLTVKAGDIEAGTTSVSAGDLKLLGGSGIDTDNAGGNVYIAGGSSNSVPVGDVILAHTGAATQGKVGIGDTTPDYPLDVMGQVSNISIYAEYDVAAYSDIRVKTDIETITEPLSKVLKMRGVTFRRTDSNLDKRQMGVIAQEVEPYVPEVVNTVEDELSDKYGHKSVSYGNLTALLIEAIKEQQEQIEELKEEVKEIKDAVSK